MPGPFALEDGDRLASLLRDAGLNDVAIERVAAPMRDPSFDEWWRRTCSLAGPLAQVLSSLPQPAIDAVVIDLRDTTAPYRGAHGDLEFPGVALLATGRVED